MTRDRRNRRRYRIRLFDYINQKTFFALLGVLIAVIAVLAYTSLRSTSEMNKLVKQTEELNHKFQQIYQAKDGNGGEAGEQIDEANRLRLTILGDIYCTTEQISDSYSSTTHQYEFKRMFANIADLVKDADIAMGTIETNFTKQDYTSGAKNNSPTEFADDWADMGLDIVNIATDHAYDYGAVGLAETKNYWKNKGLTVVGDTLEESTARIYQSGRFKIAVLSYLQNGVGTGIENVPYYRYEQAQADIAEAKKNADYVIVFMHWSGLNQSYASTKETNLADELVAAGADMIIGNHSNYVQQMEVKKNREGKNVFVAYSLGNYMLNTTDPHTKVELVLKVELRRSDVDGSVYLQQIDYVPIYAMDYGKSASPRFEYVDLRNKVESYKETPTDEGEKARYTQMKEALEWIEKIVVGG